MPKKENNAIVKAALEMNVEALKGMLEFNEKILKAFQMPEAKNQDLSSFKGKPSAN